MKILIVLTSHDKLGNTGRKTGFWLEEFAAPYYTFKEAGAEIVLTRRRAANRLSIRRATSPTFRPSLRIGSKPMQKQRRGSRQRCASIALSRKTMIPSSTRVVMGRCGISPKTRIRSS